MYQSRVFECDQLSNEAYHAETEHTTGSQLSTLFFSCPAKLRYAPRKDKKAFIFGTTAHTNMLEQARFDAEYIRMPKQEEYKDLITSEAGIKSFLKAQGVGGYSNKPVDELIRMAEATGCCPPIWHKIVKETESKAAGRIIVPGDDYDRVMAMRQVIMNNGPMREIVESGVPELSLFTMINGVKVKVRIDRVTADSCIVDYKTTRSAHGEDFGRQAYWLGYYLKMALQHDVFTAIYGREPTAVKLLPQEKDEPFLAKLYRMTKWQLDIGRQQYQAAMALYQRCIETDIWPNYGNTNDEEELPTPNSIKAMYK